MAKYLIHMMNNLSNQKRDHNATIYKLQKSKKQFLYEKYRLHQVCEDSVKRKWIYECIKKQSR